MVNSEDFGLPPRKMEYIRFLNDRAEPVRTNDLAAHFGVDPSTVTKTMTELSGMGLVAHTPYRGVRLTDEGVRYAAFIQKRHRILSLMFTHFGLSGDEACREVARFECFVSKDAIDRICRSMGHPRMSVCGEITHDQDCMGYPAAEGSGMQEPG
ncbi:MAG: metal-dependent transcriptional regulator [Methanomicrobiales archaeon]|nr:metal-dependent transcriptional regulator [Methanomicrobiales archaeon]